MPSTTHDADLTPWEQAWHDALDTLELDLEQTNALLDATHALEVAQVALAKASQWRVPAGLGPMPATVAERARVVLEAQKDTAARLARAIHQSRSHVKMLDAVDARPHARPVYLDTEG